MKEDSKTFFIKEHTVILDRIPVRRYDWDHREQKPGEPFGHPREQALYEIRIDDALVGLAHRAHGFGKQHWSIDRLCPQYGHTDGMGAQLQTPSGYVPDDRRLWTLESVAVEAVRMRSAPAYHGRPPQLATEEEIKAFVKLHRRREADEERALEARRAEWDREDAERKAAAEQHRTEVLDGLESIDTRLGSTLTNMEANALRIAIDRYRTGQ